MALHRIGKCRDNLRRIDHALIGVAQMAKDLSKAFTEWTNRTDAPDQTTRAATETQCALEDLRRQLVGDRRVWASYLQEAASEMEAKRQATVAAKGAR